MLLPLTVLWVSVTSPIGINPAAVGEVSRRAVAADGALRERHAPSAKNPAAVGANSRGAVAADGALGERHIAIGKNPAAVGGISRGAVAADGALGERHGAMGPNPAAAGVYVPAVLFPLTVLWVSVTSPVAQIPPPLANSRGAVAADGALGERHVATGRNPAAAGVTSRGAVAADGALGERHVAVGKNPAAVGAFLEGFREVLLPLTVLS